MAKYICLVILVVHAVAAVPVALKKDAPKYSGDLDHFHKEESRIPRSTAAVTSDAGVTKDKTAAAVVGTPAGTLPDGSMDSLTTQLKKLKEQVELYQMINDMLKAETQVQAMPYKIEQDEPQPAAPLHQDAVVAHQDDHHDDHHDDHNEESHHDDHDYHHEDDQTQHHQQHQPQQTHQYKRQQRYHH